jgi:lipopolysaccharide/colanic/teichoic acid biosynthesis glycosyltransferase
MTKRAVDLVLSGIGLIILSPVFLFLAVAIKWESPGPVFYRGVRVGRHGKPFRIYKFRSMVSNAETMGASSTSENDARVTRIGRFIRRYKLDEFSQLINVFLGDMSLVGPRPQVQWAVDTYTPEQRRVLELRPGITDWASIKFHNEGEIIARSGIADADEAYMRLIHPEKMRLQLEYHRRRNLWIDFKIIAATAAKLFSRKA